MMCFVNLNAAIIFWFIFLCYYKVALGIAQDVHGKNFGKHKYHKALNYEVSVIKASVLHTGSENLNYFKYKKREVPLINGEFQPDFSSTLKETAVVAEGTTEEDRSHKSPHFPFTSIGSTRQLHMSTQSNVQNTEIVKHSENYRSTEGHSSTNYDKMPLNDSANSHENQDTVFFSCLETLCNKSEESTIVIYPKRTVVLMGSNISFTCTITTNSTQEERVFWDPTNQYLSSTVTGNNTVLYFENTKLSDSGIYKCVKWHHGNCCHASVVLKVYSYPSYTMHLIIVGTVASIALLVCVVVEIWRDFYMQQYNKSQDATQEKDELLLG